MFIEAESGHFEHVTVVKVKPFKCQDVKSLLPFWTNIHVCYNKHVSPDHQELCGGSESRHFALRVTHEWPPAVVNLGLFCEHFYLWNLCCLVSNFCIETRFLKQWIPQNVLCYLCFITVLSDFTHLCFDCFLLSEYVLFNGAVNWRRLYMAKLVKWNSQRKTGALEENPLSVPLCPLKILHELSWNRTQAPATRYRPSYITNGEWIYFILNGPAAKYKTRVKLWLFLIKCHTTNTYGWRYTSINS